jgi:DNA-binding transcriptional regulator YiaG
MIDFAVNDLKFIADEFFDMFLQSGIAEQFGKGNPKYIAGKSGAELVYDTVFIMKNRRIQTEPSFRVTKTPEYWVGWSLAYYQWISGKSFKSIHEVISLEEMLKWYPTLHEADITKFVEIANERFSCKHIQTNLERIRNISGLSEGRLSKLSDVSLRTIQMCEQRNRDINKAHSMTLLKLSRTLSCGVEDLME